MNPILRAGPWGNLNNGSVSAFSPAGTAGAYPVNCARSSWPDQSWGASWIRSQQPALGSPPASGIMGLGSSITVTRATAFITINFCYQATDATYVYTSGNFGTASRGAITVLEWSVETIEGVYSSGNSSPSLGSSFGTAYDLPATVFGRFRFNISATTPTQAETGLPRQEVVLNATLS